MDRQNKELQGHHIASMTTSGAIVLNLDQLQKMDTFAYQMVLLQQTDSKVHAYQQDKHESSYIMVVPLHFYSDKKCKSFVDLLCLCSLTITIPNSESILEEVEELLGRFCLRWKVKRGSSVVKLYIEKECWVTYLDFVTFQSVQFKGNGSKELIAMKKQNAYEYCINSFREQLLPFVYDRPEQQLEQALECCTTKISQIYLSLACNQRFEIVYQVMNPHSATLAKLLKEVEKETICRKITTLGDEQCQELVNDEIAKIITKELVEYEEQLTKMKKVEQQVFLVKIMHTMIEKLRAFGFQINDQKYLFVSSKILQKVYEMHEQELKLKEEQNAALKEEIQNKQEEISKIKTDLDAKEVQDKKELKVITEQPQTVKRVKTQNQYSKKPSNFTLRDVKEPLHQINSNSLNSKLQKSGLHKVKQKLKEGFKRPEDVGKLNNGHNLRKM